MDEVVLLFVVLVLLISIPSLIQCKSKKKESSRKVDRGKAKVDARSRGVSRKKSSETAAEGNKVSIAKCLKSKEKRSNEQTIQPTITKDGMKIKAKKNNKKNKSKETTVSKTTVSTEDYDPVDEKTAKDYTEKKTRTVSTAEERLPSRREQRTQSTSIETIADKPKRKPKTEEYMESQNDDDTLRCVKSICN
ncbi:hypothetical protein CRE_25432 [Caenorhabditis remanei]|uniref:Uncharacterized protein n=1 Tax=Caenorhabditis remanei TaxID=31234 RepID=E3LT48_CAERE|nr:hypothetical protein CRE_25432 [Caenorhabditis remanei]